MKRVVSLVPSWTETLIEAGADIVGRTRFCIHPEDRVRTIEAIGGTKSFNEEKLRALAPDLIVLDREENTREMFEIASRIASVVVTHVENVQDVPRELRNLAAAFESELRSEPVFVVNRVVDSAAANESGAAPALMREPGTEKAGFVNEVLARPPTAHSADDSVAARLRAMADRFDVVLARPAPVLHNGSSGIVRQLKGETTSQMEFIYLIWQDPWMCVNANTFIASMLAQVGLTQLWAPDASTVLSDSSVLTDSSTKYPKLERLPEDKLLLLSTEPYPFGKKTPDLPNANVALVEGESFSWFGLRALKFLEAAKAP